MTLMQCLEDGIVKYIRGVERKSDIRCGNLPNAHRLVTAGTDNLIIAGEESSGRNRVLVPAQRRKVLVVVFDIPKFDEKII